MTGLAELAPLSKPVGAVILGRDAAPNLTPRHSSLRSGWHNRWLCNDRDDAATSVYLEERWGSAGVGGA